MLDEIHELVIDVYAKTPPTLQGAVLLVLIGVIVWLLVRKRVVKLDLRQARLELNEKNLELEKTRSALAESQRQSDELMGSRGELEQTTGALATRVAGLRRQLLRSRRRYRRAREEWEGMQVRFDQLRQVDADVWCRETGSGFIPPAFVPRAQRTPRFIAVQNLKGGVGKTTLVANLGAAFATGVLGRPLRVLLVDLDFQGTLSNCCAERTHLDYRRTNGLTSACLLDDRRDSVAGLLDLLVAQMPDTEGRAGIIVANEALEHADFRRQACFVLHDQEARFSHRTVFHDPATFDRYDLVLFDCPPRLTTSSINALVAADFVVIPTTLHPFDVEAVRRTLRWLKKLSQIDTYSARLGGVIVNRTYHNEGTTDKLTADERRQLDVLKLAIREFDPSGTAIFRAAVRSSPEITRFSEGHRPYGTTSHGRDVYRGVAEELYTRMML